MSEIVARHQFHKQQANYDLLTYEPITASGIFLVEAHNSYQVSEGSVGNEDDDDMVRTVQIKILDVLYKNQVCSLVYMRDITSLIQRHEDNSVYATDTFAFDTLVDEPN